MRTLALRLHPGQDLKRALVELVEREGIGAGYVLTCVGSLSQVALRLAGARERLHREGEFEILSLSGTLAPPGVHLHLAVSDGTGQVLGGHLIEGCLVRTTAELVVAADPSFVFAREPDPRTGFDELVVRPADGDA